jgi:hypothetical protein
MTLLCIVLVVVTHSVQPASGLQESLAQLCPHEGSLSEEATGCTLGQSDAVFPHGHSISASSPLQARQVSYNTAVRLNS